MNAVNVGGNALLVFGFGMGVAGVAIPTVLSRVVAAAVILALLCGKKGMRFICSGECPGGRTGEWSVILCPWVYPTAWKPACYSWQRS